VKKLSIAVVLCAALISSPVNAKTFVGVLWPMFGPLPAIGLVELVAEIKMMPDVEVETYVHQAWPSLVDDINSQPKGTRTVVIGYSLGANSSVSVANNAKYVDVIIALQPSMLSWNPNLTGRVGRMIEIYNPNPWMTFGGMGSKKLVGPNIEYIANNDSHPGAQFNSDFRTLVKTEIAKLSAGNDLEVAQAEPSLPPKAPKPDADNKPEPAAKSESANKAEPLNKPQLAGKPQLANKPEAASVKTAQAELPVLPRPRPQPVKEEAPKPQLIDQQAFLDALSSSVDSGDLLFNRRLTVADMVDYAQRTYSTSRIADAAEASARPAARSDRLAANSVDPGADR
jgi:hypothetical protein